jgi:hypothetical protein
VLQLGMCTWRWYPEISIDRKNDDKMNISETACVSYDLQSSKKNRQLQK